MDDLTDQDIDTAGTEADPQSVRSRMYKATEGTRRPADAHAPGSSGPARERTRHRRGDDDEAKARTSEFNNEPDTDPPIP